MPFRNCTLNIDDLCQKIIDTVHIGQFQNVLFGDMNPPGDAHYMSLAA